MKRFLSKVKKVIFAAKDKVACVAVSVLGGLAISPVYAEVDPSQALNKVLRIVFSILMVGGIVAIAYGAFQLFKALTSQDAGDSHSLTKGIGWIVGGIVMVAAKFVVNAITGDSSITSGSYNFFG